MTQARGKNSVSTHSTFQWKTVPIGDTERLAKNLQRRAKADDSLTLKIADCREYTTAILKKQHNTCLLAGGIDKYCWNEPREKADYLKLQWSHKIPMAHSPKKSIDNFVLLCARCNNQLQSSRTLLQLKSELAHKLKILEGITSQA